MSDSTLTDDTPVRRKESSKERRERRKRNKNKKWVDGGIKS